MNESDLHWIYIFPIFPRDLKINSDKGFVSKDNCRLGRTHWCAFYVKSIKSFYFDSFRGQPDKFVLNQLPKPIKHHNYKIQDMNSKLWGSYCLYFFYLIERMNYYDVFFKNVFWLIKYADKCF